MDASIQIIEVGETFTMMATDSGKIYSFGMNDFYQLGRATTVDEHTSSVCTINNHFDKHPSKVY